MPSICSERSLVVSIAPMPMRVVTTGMPKRSANARSSGAASPLMTPPPQ